jgi:hypothetical protein
LTILLTVDEDGQRFTNLCKFVEAELGRIKRFRVYVLYNDGAYRLAQDLCDIGEAAPILRKPPSFDLGLGITLTANQQKTESSTGNDHYFFQVMAICSLSDLETGSQKFARTFEGENCWRTAINGLKQRVGGYDPSRTQDREAALFDSAVTSLRLLVTQLGNEYPVAARVTNATQTRLSLDKGSDDGLLGAENFIVMKDLGGGLMVPMFKASTQTVLNNSSTVEIIQRNSSDPDAGAYISMFEQNPANLETHEKLLAITKGLGIPPEWDATYDKVVKTQKGK